MLVSLDPLPWARFLLIITQKEEIVITEEGLHDFSGVGVFHSLHMLCHLVYMPLFDRLSFLAYKVKALEMIVWKMWAFSLLEGD